MSGTGEGGSGGTVYDGPNINDQVVGVDYEAPGEGPEIEPEKSGKFDPGEHTVTEVQEYLAAHPDEADAVLAAEAEGKARTTLIGDSET